MIRHVRMSVEGAIRNAKDLKGAITVNGVTLYSVKDIRDALQKELAKGREVLPIGPCEGFDFKNGCPGHTKEDADIHEAVCKIAEAICKEKESCTRWCGIANDCVAYKQAKEIYFDCGGS